MKILCLGFYEFQWHLWASFHQHNYECWRLYWKKNVEFIRWTNFIRIASQALVINNFLARVKIENTVWHEATLGNQYYLVHIFKYFTSCIIQNIRILASNYILLKCTSSNICICADLHSWYLISDHSTETNIFCIYPF